MQATTLQKALSEIQDQLIVLQRGQDALAQITVNLQAQVDVSIQLVRCLVELLTPNETPDGRPRLEDLLSRMIAQQSAIIEITTRTAGLITEIRSALVDTETTRSGISTDSRC